MTFKLTGRSRGTLMVTGAKFTTILVVNILENNEVQCFTFVEVDSLGLKQTIIKHFKTSTPLLHKYHFREFKFKKDSCKR